MSVLITEENVATEPKFGEGTQYRISESCVRTALKPTFGLDRRFSEIMAKENTASLDTESDSYWVNCRLNAVLEVTGGDDLPEDLNEVSIQVVNRVIADFLRVRSFVAATQPE